MTSDRWCPRCQGAKRPSEEVCLACGITAKAKKEKTRIPLATCPGCHKEVITRDTFDIRVLHAGLVMWREYWHRDCNPFANHTKD